MSKLRQYLFFGGLLALFQWTPFGRLLRSADFAGVVWGLIVFLLIVAVLVTLPHMKKK